MFTQATLRHLATDVVFDRGQDLYRAGAVRKLERPAPTRFVARVKGTHSYHTLAWLATGGVEFSCDCPYAFEGICKHCVALGLAILEKYGASLLTAGADEKAGNEKAREALAAAWAARPATEKLRFLELALGKSDDLARQFLAFGGAEQAAADGGPASTGLLLTFSAAQEATLAECIEVALDGLLFDEDFYERNDGYDDYESEGLYAAALEEISQTLEPFVAELLALARAGQLGAALRYWAVAHVALHAVAEPAADEYGIFGDFGAEVAERWDTDLRAAGWPAVLLAAVLPPQELAATLAWVRDYLSTPPAGWDGYEAYWTPLLLAFAADTSAAPRLLQRLKGIRLSAGSLTLLKLRVAQTLGDDPAWVKAAEKLLPDDAGVGQELLNFYLSQADRPALLRAATVAFNGWPDRFAEFVLQTFSAAQAPALFRQALRHRALANGSIADFRQLRTLLEPAQVPALAAAAVARGRAGQHIAFVADVLTELGDADGLRGFVLGLEWVNVSPPAQFEYALARLAKADPTALMLEMETRLPAYLLGRARARRGIALYTQLARWLSTVREAAPRLTEPVLRLATALREEFRTLHSLRDALVQVSLLPGTEAGPTATARRGRKPR